MNIYDAAKILSVSGDIQPDQVRAAYLAACKKYHPDINPAGDEMMKIINVAYEVLRDYSGAIKDEQSDYGDLFNEALNSILSLSGLIIEICGVWIWVTGDTLTHKDALKQSGFKWASKKKAWHFRPAQHRSRSRGNTSLDDIRTKYGSKRPAVQGAAYSLANDITVQNFAFAACFHIAARKLRMAITSQSGSALPDHQKTSHPSMSANMATKTERI